eukprot:1777688-Pyramimonas_sp.AAC.2
MPLNMGGRPNNLLIWGGTEPRQTVRKGLAKRKTGRLYLDKIPGVDDERILHRRHIHPAPFWHSHLQHVR